MKKLDAVACFDLLKHVLRYMHVTNTFKKWLYAFSASGLFLWQLLIVVHFLKIWLR